MNHAPVSHTRSLFSVAQLCRANPAVRLGGAAAAPLVAVLAAVVVGAAATAAAHQRTATPSGPEVLDRAVEAAGGRAAYDKLRNRVMTGTYESPHAGLKGAAIFYSAAPNKSVGYVEAEPLGKIERGTDGDIVWEIVPAPGPGARLLAGDEAEDFKRASIFNRWVSWKKLYKSAEVTGAEKAGEEDCWRVVLKSDVLGDETAYFSKASGLLLRWERHRKNPMTGEDGVLSTDYSDYKSVDGVKVAHKTVVTFPGGSQTLVWDKIEHNVALPKDCFDPPAAVRDGAR